MQKGDAVHITAPTMTSLLPTIFSGFQSPPLASTSGLQARMRLSGVSSSNFTTRLTDSSAASTAMRSSSAVDRPVVALALALHRGIAVHADDQRNPERTGLRQVSDMAAMQHVETAVGEYQRARQQAISRGELVRRANLVFKIWAVHSIY